MEQKKVTSSVTMGLLIALVLIVISLVTYFTGLYTETWAQYVGFIVLCGSILFAVLFHAKERDNFATFGQLFGYGFRTTAAITVLMILYVVLSNYLFPDIKTKYLEVAQEQMAKNQPNASEEQVQQGLAFFEKNFTLFIVLGILFWYLIIGCITSLIGAAIAKKKPVQEFENV